MENELEGSIESFVDTTPDIWANRQELPEMFRFNGGVIGGLVRHVLENSEYNISKSHDTKVKGIQTTSEQSFDIDTPLELEIERWLHDKNKFLIIGMGSVSEQFQYTSRKWKNVHI